MPYVEGVTFGDLIEARRKSAKAFSLGEIEALLLPILGGLETLHAQGVYHRDIKPGNILITKDGGSPVLIDFGAARQMVSERSHTVIESPGYTPFEQLQSRGNVGPWSDLYALGAALHKALTGHSPPKANDRMPDDGYQPLSGRSDLVSRYGADFLSGIDRALSVRITRRWQSAGEWKASLQGQGGGNQPLPENPLDLDQNPPPWNDGKSDGDGPLLPPPPPPKLPWGKIAAACLVLTGLSIGGMLWKQGEGERAAARIAETRAAAEKARLELEAAQLAEAAKAELAEARRAKAESDRKAREAEAARIAAEDKAKAEMETAQRARDEAARLVAENAAEEARRKAAAAEPSVGDRIETEPHITIDDPVIVQVEKPKILRLGSRAGERMEVEIADGVKMAFRWCPPGTFTMGSPATEKATLKEAGVEEKIYSDETPHRVTLSKGFWLAETEVTQGQWKAVTGTTLVDQARKALEDDTLHRYGEEKLTYRDWVGASRSTDPRSLIAVESDGIAMYFVNWADAMEFCASAGRQVQRVYSGLEMRLPTEAEWEYVSRSRRNVRIDTVM
jgi:formylglycine-generating enzyme required for sulfatase activity